MSSMENLPLVFVVSAIFVVAGITVLLVAYYLRMRTREAERIIQALLELGSQHEDDPVGFLEPSLAWLKRAGVQRAHVQLNWFGQALHFGDVIEHDGTEQGCDTHQIGSGEIEAHVLLCHSPRLRGERLTMHHVVVQLWLRLLTSQINGRLAQVHLSQQQMRRYEMFYKHDLKNLVQFLTLLHTQINTCHDDECSKRLVERLRSVLPSLEHRAQRILRFLTQKTGTDWEGIEAIDLRDQLHAMAQMLELKINVRGDAQVHVLEGPFEQGLQSVLENFLQHRSEGEVQADIEEREDGVVVRLRAPAMKKPLSPEEKARMFEPFWTTSESGLGLGLYLARQNFARACHGRLDAVNMPDGGWAFELVCPKG